MNNTYPRTCRRRLFQPVRRAFEDSNVSGGGSPPYSPARFSPQFSSTPVEGRSPGSGGSSMYETCLESMGVSHHGSPDRSHERCPICLDSMLGDDNDLEASCNHRFHRDCIMQNFQLNPFCPNCRHRWRNLGGQPYSGPSPSRPRPEQIEEDRALAEELQNEVSAAVMGYRNILDALARLADDENERAQQMMDEEYYDAEDGRFADAEGEQWEPDDSSLNYYGEFDGSGSGEYDDAPAFDATYDVLPDPDRETDC